MVPLFCMLYAKIFNNNNTYYIFILTIAYTLICKYHLFFYKLFEYRIEYQFCSVAQETEKHPVQFEVLHVKSSLVSHKRGKMLHAFMQQSIYKMAALSAYKHLIIYLYERRLIYFHVNAFNYRSIKRTHKHTRGLASTRSHARVHARTNSCILFLSDILIM